MNLRPWTRVGCRRWEEPVIREVAASIGRQYRTTDLHGITERMSEHDERDSELSRETLGRWRYDSAIEAARALNDS
jgi:hypothetical protein